MQDPKRHSQLWRITSDGLLLNVGSAAIGGGARFGATASSLPASPVGAATTTASSHSPLGAGGIGNASGGSLVLDVLGTAVPDSVVEPQPLMLRQPDARRRLTQHWRFASVFTP